MPASSQVLEVREGVRITLTWNLYAVAMAPEEHPLKACQKHFLAALLFTFVQNFFACTAHVLALHCPCMLQAVLEKLQHWSFAGHHAQQPAPARHAPQGAPETRVLPLRLLPGLRVCA